MSTTIQHPEAAHLAPGTAPSVVEARRAIAPLTITGDTQMAGKRALLRPQLPAQILLTVDMVAVHVAATLDVSRTLGGFMQTSGKHIALCIRIAQECDARCTHSTTLRIDSGSQGGLKPVREPVPGLRFRFASFD